MGLFDWVNKGSAAKVDAKFPKTTQQDAPAKSAPADSTTASSASAESKPAISTPVQNEPKPTATQAAAKEEESSASSKLKQVLDTHQDCKAKLLLVIEGESDEVLDVEVVSADKHCVLGKWIYKEGKALYGGMPEYESMRKAHAEFHVYAGEALKQHLQGNKVFADVIVKTKFRNTSNKNQLMITSLFNAAKFR